MSVARRRVLGGAAALFTLGSCAPLVQRPLHPGADFAGPRFDGDKFVSFDGARLGLTTWAAKAPPKEAASGDELGGPQAPVAPADGPAKPSAEPWAVIIAVHGMDDYAETFYLAAPYWAEHGVTTYAYDARGFGRSPGRGVWPGETLMVADLRTAVAVARRRYPTALIAVVGESMGASEAMVAFAAADPPDADRVILCSPAVWGWSTLPMLYSLTLWTGAHLLPRQKVSPPANVRPTPSDNTKMLRKVSRDKLMLFNTRDRFRLWARAIDG